MSLKAHHPNFLSSSSSSSRHSVKPRTCYLFNGKDVSLYHLILNRCHTRKKGRVRFSHMKYGKFSPDSSSPDTRKEPMIFHKLRRIDHTVPFSSSVDDGGVTVNGSPQSRTSNDGGEMRFTLNQSLQDEDFDTGLVPLLHDAARAFELAIKERNSLSKTSWFSLAWPGVDKSSWAKALSYQASVYCLLQAAKEISSRGDGRDRDTNVFVQRSLSRQSAPLEGIITEKLSSKYPEAYEWFWTEQIPAVVTSFVTYFEKDQRFTAATALYRKGTALVLESSSDISLLMLALNCLAAITKLGPTRVSCPQFFSIVPDITGRLMDMLVEFVPVREAYDSIKEIGLHREFLVHFGPRAAAYRTKNGLGAEENMFWVGLVHKQLQRAIDRERIWSRLTTCESIEVLEKDLAVFGFFVALGRSTQSYLIANGFENIDEPVKGLVRYLIGGSVLYYPQLSAISSYQLFVEVVCEELDWLPFYPGSPKLTLEHKRREGPPNAEAIPLVLYVCSHWIQSFIKYSKWLQNPSSVKPAGFLSKGHNKLKACMEELGIQKNQLPVDKGSESFDKALESVEGALLRLEELLKELHVSSSSSGKEHLKAACSDLERIRTLKKEAEFLEASFSAKAASLQQGDDVSGSTRRTGGSRSYSEERGNENSDMEMDQGSSSRGLWGFFMRSPTKSRNMSSSTAKTNDDGYFEQESTSEETTDPEKNEVQRFELLRSELMALEKRVQKSTDQSEYEEADIMERDGEFRYNKDSKGLNLVPVQKKDNIIEKSLDKLKETSTDVLEGTQLLAIDVGAALELLRRAMTGDDITEKEKQALRRTLTDLASVVPIGFLMLLPVTAVGHAAMLAAIQRYAPGLIPSTYGSERLDLLRQLKKVKEMEDDASLIEKADEEHK